MYEEIKLYIIYIIFIKNSLQLNDRWQVGFQSCYPKRNLYGGGGGGATACIAAAEYLDHVTLFAASHLHADQHHVTQLIRYF